MIDIERQRHIGIKQAKKTMANIYRKNKGTKPSKEDRAELERQQMILDRWQRTSRRGVKL